MPTMEEPGELSGRNPDLFFFCYFSSVAFFEIPFRKAGGGRSLMADQEEEDLKMALRLSMQHSPPEPKRSKPRDAAAVAASAASTGGSSPEDGRRMQRELMAAAAEKRMLATRSDGAASPPSPAPSPSQSSSPVSTTPNNETSKPIPKRISCPRWFSGVKKRIS